MTAIRAQHPGFCAKCYRNYGRGAPIVRRDPYGWVHEMCGESTAKRPKPMVWRPGKGRR